MILLLKLKFITPTAASALFLILLLQIKPSCAIAYKSASRTCSVDVDRDLDRALDRDLDRRETECNTSPVWLIMLISACWERSQSDNNYIPAQLSACKQSCSKYLIIQQLSSDDGIYLLDIFKITFKHSWTINNFVFRSVLWSVRLYRNTFKYRFTHAHFL